MKEPKARRVRNGIAFNGKSYSYVLRVPDPVSGGTKPKWVGGFDSERSAKLARDKARVALGNRDYTPPTKLTVGDYLSSWVETKQVSPTTLERYRSVIKHYLIPKLGSIKLQDLRPLHIQTFYSELSTENGVTGKTLSGRSVQHVGVVLRMALKQAVEVDNLISVNPASRVKLARSVPKTPTPYTRAELNELLETAKTYKTGGKPHRLYFFFRLLAYTGARRSELLGLKWEDFDGKAININKTRIATAKGVIVSHRTKGGHNHQRRVTLDLETITQFQEHRKRQLEERMRMGEAWTETGYVFVQENGEPLYPNTVSDLYKKLIKRAGLRYNRLHDIRHIHATELLRSGEPLHVVAHRLGHRDAMVTATIYAHVDSQQAESVSENFASLMRQA